MRTIPKFIEGNKVLCAPFDIKGGPSLLTSILATLLEGNPLKKEDMLSRVGERHSGKSRGYLSNHFSALSKSGIIKFVKRNTSWTQGINYQEYMGFVFMKLIQNDEQAVTSLKYRLMPKKDDQSVDFITAPEEDIFSQPNPYLPDEA